ncbi:MAG: hypothetical protein CL701_06695 [Chloroflexi bacterium]|nr:hypothetical protein [Chloroflexota bacterium]
MSALSDLVYGKNNKPWPHFIDKYPVKVKQITELDNDQLEIDIREEGDYLGGRTAAKCFMTRWDMHNFYHSFVFVADKAMEIANDCPLATKTNTDGVPVKVSLYLNDTWGLIYNKGQSAKMHNHWPSLWSYTYCVFACEKCSPLVFPNAQEYLSVTPKTSQMIVFPAWLQHEVPMHTCEHDRIMISGNLTYNAGNQII